MSLPLTRLEASRLLDDYRVHCWPADLGDRSALIDVLVGMSTHRDTPVGADVACRALDHCDATLRRMPAERELADAIDFVTSDASRVRHRIDDARRAIDALKARRDDDHRRLRAESEARRTA